MRLIFDCVACGNHDHECACAGGPEFGAMRYVNAYRIDREYGGPEEGGWWYDSGEPVAAIPVTSAEEAAEVLEKAKALFPRTKNRSRVNGGEDYDVMLERYFPKPFPAERPHYE